MERDGNGSDNFLSMIRYRNRFSSGETAKAAQRYLNDDIALDKL